MMKNNNNLSEDELRQKVDGFSINTTNENTIENGYKIVNEPLYKTHSGVYDKEKKNK